MASFRYDSELYHPRITIRSAIPEDAAALVAYFKEVINQTQNLTMTSDELYVFDDEEAFLTRMEASHNSIVLLAMHEEIIVGCITFVGGHNPALCHQGELGITVEEKWWGKGIGTVLMQALLTWAGRTRISKVNLQVRKDNDRAIALYKKFDFSLEAVQKGKLCVEGELIDLLWFGLYLPGPPLRVYQRATDVSSPELMHNRNTDGVPCTIRHLHRNDAAAVLMFAEQFTQSRPELFSTSDIPGVGNSLTEQQVLLSSHRDTPHWNCFGAITQEGNLVGLLTCEAGTRTRTKHAATCTLSLLPDWNTLGLGTAMVLQLVSWAQLTSIQRLDTHVLTQNYTLVSAFVENGFENEGTITRSMVFLSRYSDSLVLARYL